MKFQRNMKFSVNIQKTQRRPSWKASKKVINKEHQLRYLIAYIYHAKL